jgi:hypothetical protein
VKPPNSDANRPGNTPGSRAPEAAKPSVPSPANPSIVPGAKSDPVTGKPDVSGPKPDASKANPSGEGAKPASPVTAQPGAAKAPEPLKASDATKPAEASKSFEAPKTPGAIKPGEGPKVVEIGKPAEAKSAQPEASKDTGKVEQGKVEPGNAEAIKGGPNAGEATKAEPVKEAPKTATFPGGSATPVRPAGAATDGPIIDLKAKRLPDPPPAQKTAATGTGAMGAGSGPGIGATPGAAKPGDKASDPKTTSGASTPEAAKTSGTTGGTTPKIPSAPAAAAAAPRGPGFGSVATAGLLGGVIGAGLLFGIERAGVLPPADDGRLAALDQRIAALAPKDEVARLSQRIASNETALKAVPEAVSTAREALQKASAVPAPAADGAAPSAATLPAEITARLDSLDQRISALQEEPGQQGGEPRMTVAPSNGEAQQVTALADRVKTLEGQIAAVQKPAEQPDLAPKLAALQTAVEARVKANTEATQSLDQKLTEVQQNLDAKVQAATQASQQAAETAKAQASEAAKGIERQVETQIQAQGEKIAGIDKALSARAETATVQAALRVVAADRIVTALNAGTPYADALAALRNYEPGDPAKLTAVAVFADRGAPTARTLAAEFRTVADKIAASRRAAQVRSVAETGDLGQKLMSMAESIVQVRKVDTPAPAAQGIAAADPLPKVQDALDRGAVGEAAQAFAALPENVRAEAGDFGTRLKSRAAAGEAAQGLLAEAFKGLPGAGAQR